MSDQVATLIQGGAVGIAILLIGYMWAKDRMYNKTLNNHLFHLDETLGRLDATMQQISTNHENMKSVLSTNTRMVGENMKMLDRLKGFLSGKR